MENPFSRLLKVLSLERKQGYRNKAVIGGLDKFASRWEAEARSACDNQSLVNEIVALMLGYPAVEGQTARERIVEQLTRRAREAEGVTGPPIGEPEARPRPESAPSRAEGAAGRPKPAVEKAGPPAAQTAAAADTDAGESGTVDEAAPSTERQAALPASSGAGSEAEVEPPDGKAEPELSAERTPAPKPARPQAPEPPRSEIAPARAKPAWNKPESGAAREGTAGALPGAPSGAPGGLGPGGTGPGGEGRREADRAEGPGREGPGRGERGPRISDRGAADERHGRVQPPGEGRREGTEPARHEITQRWAEGGESAGRESARQHPAHESEAPRLQARPAEKPAPPEGNRWGVQPANEPEFEDELLSQLFDMSTEEHEGAEPGENAGEPGSSAGRGTRPPAAAAGVASAGEGRESRPGHAQGTAGHGLDAPVTRLPSIGPSFAEKLAKLGVQTVRDLLYLMPHRYEDYSALATIDKLHYGDEVTVVGTIWHVDTRPLGENRRMVTAVIGDGTGEIQATWFNPYVERQLRTGRAYLFSGKIDSFRGQLQMRGPEFEPLDSLQIHTARLVPIYPLTQGLNARWLRRVMKNTVDAWAGSVPDPLPAGIREELGLMPLPSALAHVHFPDNQNLLAAARRRLSFDEFFVLQLGVLRYRHTFRSQTARALNAAEEILAPFLSALPFAMTGAQRRSLDEIAADVAQPQPMSRLLQGDVGSGKTAVAAAALWVAVANGTQGAIMAPTEILSEQHARSLGRLFEGLAVPDGRPVRIGLLTGRQSKAERDEALAALSAGEIDIAVGTHALIQEGVAFHDLTVAVVDEQHRFGVEQRAALRQKGIQPHMLVMSATPIPRSLALTLYGDLDVSVIDEMPAGRTPIKTRWLTSTYRERAYSFIRRQIEEGRQVFIIYPLVEGSDHSDAKAAVDEHARLQSQVFPNLRLGLLHGRMKGEEKDAVMRAFAEGALDVLVATSVVEVGIDVPNATVILIEGAEHFGLAQLHQFRGRVGRGAYPSYCILISDAEEGGSSQRLQALETSNDGFALAQTDLEMRGPGDFLGTRQSGLPPLQMAQLSDLRTLEEARAAAQKLFASDPDLSQPEHALLAERVAEFWHGAGDVS